jgi:hypothetical protein
MRSVKDVEAYLERMNRAYQSAPGTSETFLVSSGENYPPVALRVDPPLVVLRVSIGAVPDEPLELFRKMLQLNARELVHSSYGVADGHILLSSALELENLDYNELEAALDEIDLALAQQVPELSALSKNVASK